MGPRPTRKKLRPRSPDGQLKSRPNIQTSAKEAEYGSVLTDLKTIKTQNKEHLQALFAGSVPRVDCVDLADVADSVMVLRSNRQLECSATVAG